MREPRSPNVASPVIFLAVAGVLVFLTYVLYRGFLGLGVHDPGLHANVMLVLMGVLLGAVWGTICFIAYQLWMISTEPSAAPSFGVVRGDRHLWTPTHRASVAPYLVSASRWARSARKGR